MYGGRPTIQSIPQPSSHAAMGSWHWQISPTPRSILRDLMEDRGGGLETAQVRAHSSLCAPGPAAHSKSPWERFAKEVGQRVTVDSRSDKSEGNIAIGNDRCSRSRIKRDATAGRGSGAFMLMYFGHDLKNRLLGSADSSLNDDRYRFTCVGKE
ncbi:hypothetical protein BDN67DRAFT_985163 [Paxillus ammoniavirescens]|nr:hypothetical protein BDN67DRAFT_985163 [Paxillus ammoniavirescens]